MKLLPAFAFILFLAMPVARAARFTGDTPKLTTTTTSHAVPMVSTRQTLSSKADGFRNAVTASFLDDIILDEVGQIVRRTVGHIITTSGLFLNNSSFAEEGASPEEISKRKEEFASICNTYVLQLDFWRELLKLLDSAAYGGESKAKSQQVILASVKVHTITQEELTLIDARVLAAEVFNDPDFANADPVRLLYAARSLKGLNIKLALFSQSLISVHIINNLLERVDTSAVPLTSILPLRMLFSELNEPYFNAGKHSVKEMSQEVSILLFKKFSDISKRSRSLFHSSLSRNAAREEKLSEIFGIEIDCVDYKKKYCQICNAEIEREITTVNLAVDAAGMKCYDSTPGNNCSCGYYFGPQVYERILSKKSSDYEDMARSIGRPPLKVVKRYPSTTPNSPKSTSRRSDDTLAMEKRAPSLDLIKRKKSSHRHDSNSGSSRSSSHHRHASDQAQESLLPSPSNSKLSNGRIKVQAANSDSPTGSVKRMERQQSTRNETVDRILSKSRIRNEEEKEKERERDFKEPNLHQSNSVPSTSRRKRTEFILQDDDLTINDANTSQSFSAPPSSRMKKETSLRQDEGIHYPSHFSKATTVIANPILKSTYQANSLFRSPSSSSGLVAQKFQLKHKADLESSRSLQNESKATPTLGLQKRKVETEPNYTKNDDNTSTKKSNERPILAQDHSSPQIQVSKGTVGYSIKPSEPPKANKFGKILVERTFTTTLNEKQSSPNSSDDTSSSSSSSKRPIKRKHSGEYKNQATTAHSRSSSASTSPVRRSPLKARTHVNKENLKAIQESGSMVEFSDNGYANSFDDYNEVFISEQESHHDRQPSLSSLSPSPLDAGYLLQRQMMSMSRPAVSVPSNSTASTLDRKRKQKPLKNKDKEKEKEKKRKHFSPTASRKNGSEKFRSIPKESNLSTTGEKKQSSESFSSERNKNYLFTDTQRNVSRFTTP